MNAFNTVNLAAACILTSTAFAQNLGIPESKWIYPLGGAGTSDSEHFWHRPNYYTSPSISRSIDATLDITGITKDDIDLYDFYSCFPIVPKLAAHHLGLPITGGPKPLTLLGGLTSFGGAGNNYSMHALTEMTRQIRAGKGKRGLVLCNGGWLSYQYVVVLSKEPRSNGAYPEKNPLSDYTGVPAPEMDTEAEGEGVVEVSLVHLLICLRLGILTGHAQTYTVAYSRDGSPSKGHIVGRLKSNGKRFLANHGDENTLQQMASGASEIVGRTGWVRQDSDKKGRGLFSFGKTAKM
jgi:hypothetical protein